MHTVFSELVKRVLLLFRRQSNRTLFAAISITGSAEQLVCAATVIKLVDTNEKYDVRFLDIEPGKAVSDTGKIEAQLSPGYSIGSLLEGPDKDATAKAIVCFFKSKQEF